MVCLCAQCLPLEGDKEGGLCQKIETPFFNRKIAEAFREVRKRGAVSNFAGFAFPNGFGRAGVNLGALSGKRLIVMWLKPTLFSLRYLLQKHPSQYNSFYFQRPSVFEMNGTQPLPARRWHQEMPVFR